MTIRKIKEIPASEIKTQIKSAVTGVVEEYTLIYKCEKCGFAIFIRDIKNKDRFKPKLKCSCSGEFNKIKQKELVEEIETIK
jgi:hypothetical protein